MYLGIADQHAGRDEIAARASAGPGRSAIDATSLPATDVAERIAKEAEKRIAEAGQPG